MRHVPDDERRARLAVRHALAPAHRVASPSAVTRAMTALHSTEPASVHLACWARCDAIEPGDVDRALYTDRTLVKQLAMRRTLFAVPRDLLPALWPSASARVAAAERARLTAAGPSPDWLDQARASILSVLADVPGGLTGREIRPMVGGAWPVSQVITYLGATADLARGVNAAPWYRSRPRWTRTGDWLPSMPPVLSAADGYQEIVRRWLYTFGPGTEDDIVWWLGGTKAVVRAALAGVGAVAVTLDRGETGWLLPDDLGEVADPGPWVALLPMLDPTVMGWRGRDFYLGPHRESIFESHGNAGTTAWSGGRVVGCWLQDQAGAVRVRLVEPVAAGVRRALDAEADRLTGWLAGVRVPLTYMSPAMSASSSIWSGSSA